MNKIIKMTDEEYRKADGLSNSYLLLFDISPMHAQVGRKKTKAMEEGSLAHSFILNSGEKFEDKFISKNYEKLLTIKKNINNYVIIDGLTYKQIAEKSQKEIAIFWKDPNFNGLQRKGKLDLLFEGENYNIIIDLKKTTDCMDFEYTVRKYKLYRQSQWYIEGVTFLTGKKTIFIFLVFEWESPFGVKAFILDDEYLTFAEVENMASILKYVKWKEDGSKITNYKTGIEILSKPGWLK